MKKFYIFTNLELNQRNFERFDIKILLNFFDKIEIFHINRGYNFVLMVFSSMKKSNYIE